MAGIAKDKHAPQRQSGRVASRRRYLAFAYAAAAVIIIAIAVHRAPPPPQRAGATMMRTDATEWPVLARASSSSGELTIRGRGDEVLIEGSSTAGGPVTVEWDGDKFFPANGSATFPAPPVRLQLKRRPGSAGGSVIRLRLPGQPVVEATIELR